MFERFTDRARRALTEAGQDAREMGHGFIGTEHVLLGLLHEGVGGVAAAALERLGFTYDDVATTVVEVVGGRPPEAPDHPSDAEVLATIGIDLDAVRASLESTFGAGVVDPKPFFTPRAKKLLELSLREALAARHNYIGTEHLLLGATAEGEGVASQILAAKVPLLVVRLTTFAEMRRAAALNEGRDPGYVEAEAIVLHLVSEHVYRPRYNRLRQRAREITIERLRFRGLDVTAESTDDEVSAAIEAVENVGLRRELRAVMKQRDDDADAAANATTKVAADVRDELLAALAALS